jgi:hypothetical protein
MGEGRKPIQEAKAELMEMLSEWRGASCVAVDFTVERGHVRIEADFLETYGVE